MTSIPQLRVLDLSEESRQRLESILRTIDGDYEPPVSDQVDLADYARKLWQHAVNIVADVEGADVGFVSMYANDLTSRQAFITSIGVRRERWGSGLAQQLIRTAEDHARDRGMRRIRLEVSIENVRAVRFYAKMGFAPVDPEGQEGSASVFLAKGLEERCDD
jgi:GNAT superfamily N-acetyltransferase